MTNGLPEATEPLRETLGANIRSYRKAHKLTQERLAEQLGFSTRYVAGVERGEENLTLDSVDQLARLMDVDLLRLITGGPWDGTDE